MSWLWTLSCFPLAFSHSLYPSEFLRAILVYNSPLTNNWIMVHSVKCFKVVILCFLYYEKYADLDKTKIPKALLCFFPCGFWVFFVLRVLWCRSVFWRDQSFFTHLHDFFWMIASLFLIPAVHAFSFCLKWMLSQSFFYKSFLLLW